MKRVIHSAVIISVLLSSSLALAQYEEESYVEGFVAGNYTLPMGYIKDDLVPDSLNATSSLGYDFGLGYYVTPKLIVGLYFNLRNMGTEEENLKLNHRVYEVGSYGKYLISDLSEKSLSPYIRLFAGLTFSKLVTEVAGESGPVFRELSYDPALGVGGALGIQYKTNDFGFLYLEGAYHYDMMDGVTGDFRGVEYEWPDNGQYFAVKAGIAFNIGPKE